MLPVNHNQVQLVEAQATIRATNERIVHLWLSRKSEKTQKAYLTDIAQFLSYLENKPLNRVTPTRHTRLSKFRSRRKGWRSPRKLERSLPFVRCSPLPIKQAFSRSM